MVILPHFTAHPDRWGTLCHAANNRLNRHATYVSTQKIPTRRAACPPCAIRFFPCAHKTGLFSRFPAYSPPMGITVQTIRASPVSLPHDTIQSACTAQTLDHVCRCHVSGGRFGSITPLSVFAVWRGAFALRLSAGPV